MTQMRGQMKIRPILGGWKSYLAFGSAPKLFEGDALDSARYTYGVWLRHLVLCASHDLSAHPKRVVELGPGTSLGAGFAALLTGSESYVAIDEVAYLDTQRLLQEFDLVAELVGARAAIPEEHPLVRPLLPSYGFPHRLLPEERVAVHCAPARIAQIRAALAGLCNRSGDGPLHYGTWDAPPRIEPGSVDLVLSQAVMQDVADLAEVYGTAARWLRPGGIMSHQIDFDSQGLASQWNGYWAISEPMWRVVRGRRAYVLNRQPLSRHLDLLNDLGMRIVAVVPVVDETGIRRHQLDGRFHWVTDDDLRTKSAHILAVKPPVPSPPSP